MKVKFTKEWCGPYGIFEKGRLCELSGAMLAACPRDVIEEVKPEQEGTEPDGKKEKDEKTKHTTKKG